MLNRLIGRVVTVYIQGTGMLIHISGVLQRQKYSMYAYSVYSTDYSSGIDFSDEDIIDVTDQQIAVIPRMKFFTEFVDKNSDVINKKGK